MTKEKQNSGDKKGEDSSSLIFLVDLQTTAGGWWARQTKWPQGGATVLYSHSGAIETTDV